MLITNAVIVTWEEENRILADQALYIDEGRSSSSAHR
jgi:hypothetical protein